MIRKNVDIIAIAILLAVMGLYSEAREMMLLDTIPNHGVVLSHDMVDHLMPPVTGVPVPPLPPLVISH